MIDKSISKKINQIQIKTKKILSGTLIGDFSTAIKGSGLEFDQIREYQQGDDVRFVDWKSSARNNKLLVKEYLEERNRDVLIAIDVSASSFFGSKKFDIISQIACVLTIVCEYGKDNVGLIFFSDEVHQYFPPSRSKSYVFSLMKSIMSFNEIKAETKINSVLDFISKRVKKRSLIFLLSDFIDETLAEKKLSTMSNFHEFVAVRYLDDKEVNIPKVGILNLIDIESGKNVSIDTGTQKINNALLEFKIDRDKLLRKCKVDILDITNKNDFVSEVILFFKRRMMY